MRGQTRRQFLKTAGCLTASLTASAALPGCAAAGPAGGNRTRQPNVVLIITDDQGWGDIRSHGNEKIDTPVLDQLAADGARFERFFVSPVCAPTRASLLTGRYYLRTGTHGVTRGYENMRTGEITVAEVLKQSGYVTGCFGKWHNGAHYPHNPNGQGFDEFLGFCAGHWNNYFNTTLERNGKPTKTRGYITDVLTDAALQFIERHRSEPFFCYVPYNAPHGPFQVPDKYFDKYKARGLDDKLARPNAIYVPVGARRSTGAYPWWEIEVVEPGRFEVTLMYTCAAKNVGTKLRVEIAGKTLEGAVEKPYDPQPIAGPDRVPRGEVYEKVWAPLTLGTIELAKARTKLMVRALEIPGNQALDLKAVRLRRV